MTGQFENKYSDLITSFPEGKLATLLGLSIGEYHELNHRGLMELTDISGKIIEYYIHVNSNNKTGILSKLNMDQYGYIRFKPEEVNNVRGV